MRLTFNNKNMCCKECKMNLWYINSWSVKDKSRMHGMCVPFTFYAVYEMRSVNYYSVLWFWVHYCWNTDAILSCNQGEYVQKMEYKTVRDTMGMNVCNCNSFMETEYDLEAVSLSFVKTARWCMYNCACQTF